MRKKGTESRTVKKKPQKQLSAKNRGVTGHGVKRAKAEVKGAGTMPNAVKKSLLFGVLPAKVGVLGLKKGRRGIR